MKLAEVLAWLDSELEPGKFDDVSNNGLQIGREGDTLERVAFGVDASADFFARAAKENAQLCVVHHGISWGGGIKRLSGGVYNVVREAISSNIALYASHLPLDANMKYGNNWEIARFLDLAGVQTAFSYHGNTIGVVGVATRNAAYRIGQCDIELKEGMRIGVCSGGAGEFAEDAKNLGCDLLLTGESSWADVIAAENVGMKMLTAGHYETETFGVKALAKAMRTVLGVDTVFIDRP